MSKTDNSNHDWSELNEQRNYKSLNDGKVLVVAPKGHQDFVVPLFCPLCKNVMKTREDAEKYRDRKMCHHCADHWEKGKEINFASEEWEEYIEGRFLSPPPIINIV